MVKVSLRPVIKLYLAVLRSYIVRGRGLVACALQRSTVVDGTGLQTPSYSILDAPPSP